MLDPVSANPESDTGSSVAGNLPVLLLVGGLGTRLRPILSGTPKPLAKLGGASFLELLVRQLRFQGFRRLIMCTGYLSLEIEKQFGDGRAWEIEIEYSTETQPLGTGGAVKLASRHLQGDAEFLVMNGDSFIQIDFHHLIATHHKHVGWVTLASRKVDNASRYGLLRVDSDGWVRSFEEKSTDEISGLVNAGVYVFQHAVLDHIPAGPASLEKDVFPRLLKQGVYSVAQDGIFIDIGTPEDYERAQKLCDRLYSAILPTNI
ncbi:MAG: nucleotidyltransferase [Acidobacteria bacterium]|nr:MAG: nucleotidyltransferase [Acidobacteriota bacterium]PYY03444.1 MAG: nucleotidyltransferase [Acidobacteriota bacterium]PYY23164.1 MAG: nucleotidyltransferase [Acidobacteriota bacterium]